MKNKLTLAATVAVAALTVTLTGCTSIINTPQGKVLSVTQRGIGLAVDYAPQSSSPEVKFGFFSSAVVILPTSTTTNAPVNSPNFANTFGFGQNGALNLNIDENIASGNYQTLSPGNTNSALATQPVVPK
jgi:hypothetical protein